MKLPLRCACGHESMVDMERMETRPISNLLAMEGYVCKHCGEWKSVFALTVSLVDTMRKLDNLSPTHPSFRYRFAKTMRKAMGVQAKAKIHG